MVHSLPFRSERDATDPIWSQLKQAIATSSGFQRWVLERGSDRRVLDSTLDVQVQTYLRQTLETLAY